MDQTRIYSKTPKGVEEIARRTLKLPAKLRQVLILVDGQRDAATLVEQLDTLGDVVGYLDTLEQLDLISCLDDLSATHSSYSAAESVLPDLVTAKRDISRMLVDGLGPGADLLTLKIEATQTRESLIQQCKACRVVMENVLGKAQGDEFWARASRLLLG